MDREVARAVRVIADECSSLAWEDVPEPVQDRTRMVLFDTLGVLIAGAESVEMRSFASQYNEPGNAPLVGVGRRATVEASCWVNGAALCALELDEGSKFARGHPGAHTIPAALALGNGQSGTSWLTAILVGYEVAARFGRATRLAEGVHPHGTWGSTGAAALTAHLLDLGPEAIGAAIDAASGLTLAPHFESALGGHPVRNLWVGASNNNGIAAGRLAATGLGEIHGTAARTFGELIGVFDVGPIAVPFEERFEIMHGYFKRHASCAYTHAAVDATLLLLDGPECRIDDIESVRVETYSMAAALNRTSWPTRLSALFSVPYVVAVVLAEGRFGPSSSDSDHRSDPSIGRLAASVTVVATDEFDRRLPERRGARVNIIFKNGVEMSASVEQPVGDSANEPLGWTELRRKIAGLIGASRGVELEQAVRALDVGPAADLVDTLVDI
ncbi:MAG: MmgE/PrpD family protein [Actinomycetia bacterium]|nr:MmgE/PrpD family protein [Actinomycetes bacterium]